MANICNNLFYAYSEDKNNLNTIKEFFENWESADIEESDENIDILFDSKWTFPEENMEELFQLIPNKEDIYMRCLSYEFGNMYYSLWECDKDGWREV